MLPINQKLACIGFILVLPGLSIAQNSVIPEAEIQISIDKRYENVYTFEVVNQPDLDQIAGGSLEMAVTVLKKNPLIVTTTSATEMCWWR